MDSRGEACTALVSAWWCGWNQDLYTITEPKNKPPSIPNRAPDAKWWWSKHVFSVLAVRPVTPLHYLWGKGRANTKTCWLAGSLAGLMVALLAFSNPARLHCLSRPPSVIGKSQWSPKWECCVSLAGSSLQGLVVLLLPLLQPAPLQSPSCSNPYQVAWSHTVQMYSH